jgi:hypothetical protein
MPKIGNMKIVFLIFIVLVAILGCNKERIIESTEYIHDIQYVESPPDTVFHLDTLIVIDTVGTDGRDTVLLLDTVFQVSQVHDTVKITVTVHDTVFRTQYIYDTVFDVDTVVRTTYKASTATAIEAMQAQTDPLVLDYIYENYGYETGWIFYLASSQMEVAQSSTTVWDIYGYLEYYTEDWSEYMALEFYWRMTYLGGDPSLSSSWQISEPPSAASIHQPGINKLTKAAPASLAR